jgi:putative ABC transport system permease protein
VSRLAGLNIRKNINRNAVAAGAVFLAISLYSSVSNIVFSMRSSVMHWLETTSNYDLIVTAGHTFSANSGKHVPMPLEMRDEIKRIEGVNFTDMYRQILVPFKGSNLLLASTDIKRKLEYSSFVIAKGKIADIKKLLPGQDNIIVSENLALRYGVKTGDSLVLTTPGGPVSFGVVAIIVDFSYEFGSAIMDNNTYQKYWHDRLADAFTVQVKKGHEISAVRDAIQKTRGKEMRLFVLTLDEYRSETKKIFDQVYKIFHAMDILTLSIACIGIIITLLASVLERTREIGIIRSFGAFKRQVSKIVVLESVLLGITGCGLGIICGTFLGWMGIEGLVNGEIGMSVLYRIDSSAILKAIAFAVVFSALAGLYPARQAAKTNIVEALAYE